EMGLWVRDGATPWQTLVAATRDGAEICGVGAELGTVEAGKLADLIVVGASTTVAILMWRSDLLPTGREEENERCADRGDAGALGVVAAGGKGADAPALYAGACSGIGGSVS